MKAHAVAGQSVLIIGSGSGSEIIAALELNLRVFAVEMDVAQWRATNDRITHYAQNREMYLGGNDPAYMDVYYQMEKDAIVVDEEDEEAPAEEKKSRTERKKGILRSKQEKADALPAPPPQEIHCAYCDGGASSLSMFTKCVHCESLLHKIRPAAAPPNGNPGCGVKCVDHNGAMACTNSCIVVSHPPIDSAKPAENAPNPVDERASIPQNDAEVVPDSQIVPLDKSQ